jgi:hypothetical protein
LWNFTSVLEVDTASIFSVENDAKQVASKNNLAYYSTMKMEAYVQMLNFYRVHGIVSQKTALFKCCVVNVDFKQS